MGALRVSHRVTGDGLISPGLKSRILNERQAKEVNESNVASDKHLLRAILELIAKCKTLEELRESVARILKEE